MKRFSIKIVAIDWDDIAPGSLFETDHYTDKLYTRPVTDEQFNRYLTSSTAPIIGLLDDESFTGLFDGRGLPIAFMGTGSCVVFIDDTRTIAV